MSESEFISRFDHSRLTTLEKHYELLGKVANLYRHMRNVAIGGLVTSGCLELADDVHSFLPAMGVTVVKHAFWISSGAAVLGEADYLVYKRLQTSRADKAAAITSEYNVLPPAWALHDKTATYTDDPENPGRQLSDYDEVTASVSWVVDEVMDELRRGSGTADQ